MGEKMENAKDKGDLDGETYTFAFPVLCASDPAQGVLQKRGI